MSDKLDKMRAKLQSIGGKVKHDTRQGEPEVSLDQVLRKRELQRIGRQRRESGNRFERYVAKVFMDWCGEMLRRTPMSGGWSKASFGVTGDLVCPNPRFPFHVECKDHEKWKLEDLLTGARASGNTSIVQWWKQTTTECPQGKLPMLVFTRSRGDVFAMMFRHDLRQIGDAFIDFLPHLTFNFDTGDVAIFILDHFFARVRPPKGLKGHKTWQQQTIRK